ncbi:hypothetical protein BDZ85DRAFT_265052 [Elsinoe ampelina]|uniref:Uncharacterized protein n=1 Tax=Elsinoe ampelina TaxID=302913 RepID=A0A6A6G935_9PEZI|nr:hypothetical protein BDZ85DRAFT_265052 [Elsinoe ampelina]
MGTQFADPPSSTGGLGAFAARSVAVPSSFPLVPKDSGARCACSRPPSPHASLCCVCTTAVCLFRVLLDAKSSRSSMASIVECIILTLFMTSESSIAFPCLRRMVRWPWTEACASHYFASLVTRGPF